MAWPPPDRELDGYDVLDVPKRAGAPESPLYAEATTPGPESVPPESARGPDGHAAEFVRPDWSELRLRTAVEDQQRRSPWLWVLTAVLTLATLGQAAYIWHLHSTRLALASGRLRVDGPAGAEVRVNGQGIGRAPVDHPLEPGGYMVEVVLPNGSVRADDVIIGLGRTVVVTSPAATTPATATGSVPPARPGPVAAGESGDGPPSAVAGQAGAALGPAATPVEASGSTVSSTMGAVLIESTPPGQAVTMGGRARGVTPLTVGLVRPGRHDVMVGGVFRRVDVVAGEVATLRVP